MPRANKPRQIHAREALAANIQRHRQIRRWTPEGLAQRMHAAGCPIQTSAIYKIEKHGRTVDADELVTFAGVFDVSVAELLGQDPDPWQHLPRGTKQLVYDYQEAVQHFHDALFELEEQQERCDRLEAVRDQKMQALTRLPARTRQQLTRSRFVPFAVVEELAKGGMV